MFRPQGHEIFDPGSQAGIAVAEHYSPVVLPWQGFSTENDRV